MSHQPQLEKPGKMQLRISIPNARNYVIVPVKLSEFYIICGNSIGACGNLIGEVYSTSIRILFFPIYTKPWGFYGIQQKTALMKAFLFQIYFLTAILYSFGQSRVMYQPDSIYTKNSVKSRIVSFDSGSNKGVLIYNYDKKGRLIDYGLTDNETGKGYQFRIIYKYDSSNKIKTDIKLAEDSNDNNHSKYFYNSIGLQTAKYTFDKFENIIEKDTIRYDPYIETEVFFDADTITRQQTAIYEDGYLFAYTRFFGYQFYNGEKSSWNYRFKNYVDSFNRIIKREDGNPRVTRITYFIYNKRGLLVKTIEKSVVPNGFPDVVQYIEYKYW